MYKQRILIVDDVKGTRGKLFENLEGQFETKVVRDVQSAVEVLEKYHAFFNFILLERNISISVVEELMQILRAKKWYQSLPVGIVTENFSKKYTDRAYELGVTACFLMPEEQDIICQRIAKIIEHTFRDNLDYLTGGYNRKGFNRVVREYLTYALQDECYAMLYFNIKNFKAVNELYSYEEGDHVLRRFYKDLMKSAFKPIYIARLYSDHFVCLVNRKNLEYDNLGRMCTTIYEHEGKKMRLLVRCGIYYIDNRDASINGMIDRAKLAKKYIVDEFIKPYAIFDDSMAINYVDQAALETEFMEAIENEEFKVYYQPVVETATGRIASAEALIRWQHPTRGFVSPGLFISVLEQGGHISELDWYVTQKVYGMIADRIQHGKAIVPVSVNLSWMDFYSDDMIEHVIEQCDDESLKGMVRFEVTETSYASLTENRSSVLGKMRNKGIKILLDDFGSGYSSFGMIKDYDFDILKIDMSFVRQIEENRKVRGIIRAIVDMCHQLGIRVIAEGAETEDQIKFLKDIKCDYVQGYYYSKPISEEEFLAKIEAYDKDKRIVDPRIVEAPRYSSYFKESINFMSHESEQAAKIDEFLISKVLEENNAVGIVCGAYDSRFTMHYISDIALSLMGYTFDVFHQQSEGSYLKMIADEDVDYFLRAQDDLTRIYRLKKADGSHVMIVEKRVNTTNSDGELQWVCAIHAI